MIAAPSRPIRRQVGALALCCLVLTACGPAGLTDAEVAWCADTGRFLAISRAAESLHLDQKAFESQYGQFLLARGEARKAVGPEFSRACRAAHANAGR